MALPANGVLSFNEIGVELQRASGSILNITTAETGGYVALNPYSTYKPDGVTPCSVSEWYNYNHTQIQLVPFFQIVKSSPSNVNVNTNFSFNITVANSGNASTNGSIVVVTDTMPSNMQFVSSNAPGWNVTLSGQTIQATRYDGLAPNNAYPDISITVKIINCASGAYYNQASVYGGGSEGTRSSNTTTTNASVFSGTVSLTRSIQRNNCGTNCVGTYVDVTSPSFTRTSCVSQADANALATSDANNWLDANGQGVANANGTCNCNPPSYLLTKTLDSATPIYEGGSMQWKVQLTVFGTPTSSTVTIIDDIGAYFTVTNHSKPTGWTFYQSGDIINIYTSNVLTVGATYDFYITLTANTRGSYTNSATVQGGGGSSVSASANVTISAPVQPVFSNFVESNNANPIYRSSSNTTAVHLFDDNTVTHIITFTLSSASVAPNSIRILASNAANITRVNGGVYTNQWSYNGTEFTNTGTLSPGTYTVAFLDYKVLSFGFLGLESASHQFSLYYNNSQITSSFSQYNVAGRAKIDVRLSCTFSGTNNDWLGNYIFYLNMMNWEGNGYYSFSINDVNSKDWLIVTLYPTIGSGEFQQFGTQSEAFPSSFNVSKPSLGVSYSIFGQCNITNSLAIRYQQGNPYWFDTTRRLYIDFDSNDGSFITC